MKNEVHQVLNTMDVYGGGFVKQLVVLMRHADADNARRLLQAFPELFDQYDEMTSLVTGRKVEGV
jgi:hypothetical protein